MKFPRHSRLLRGPFDLAPFAAVFFLLLAMLLLGGLLPTPGVPLRLPPATDLPGADGRTVNVAVDAQGQLYFANQLISEWNLKGALSRAAHASHDPVTMVIHADQSVSYGQLIHLTQLARETGVENAILATLPADSPPDAAP
jgi:biopolymer transport protein ExbD